MSKKEKMQALTIYLHNEKVKKLEDCLKKDYINTDFIREFNLKEKLGLKGKIFIAKPSDSVPKWLETLQDISNDDIGESVKNSSNKAVIIVELNKRFFSITYGYGSSLLRDSTIENDFGIKTVANVIEPSKIRSLNSMKIENSIVDKQQQSSKYASQDQFQIDSQTDILKSMAGSPNDETLGSFISGTDSLKIHKVMDISKLKSTLELLYSCYQDNKYKVNGFDWIDHVDRIKDSSLKDNLNSVLVENIQHQNFEGIQISPNEIIDWNSVSDFKLTGQKTKPTIEIKLNEYLNGVDKKIDIISKLKRDYLITIDDNGDEHNFSTIYNSLIFETEYEDQRYSMIYGKWYKIDSSFYESVKNKVSKISICHLSIPQAMEDEKEGDYNSRVASTCQDYVLFDQKNYSSQEMGRSRIEPCDLFTKDNKLIHIKRKTSSATLSHLFQQGLTSAEIIRKENSKGLRKHMDKIIRKDKKFSYESNILESPTTDIEIVYGIIHGKTIDFCQSLPFFSLLTLIRAEENLRSWGFKVSLLHIPLEKLGKK